MGQDSRRRKALRRRASEYKAAHFAEIAAERQKRVAEKRGPDFKWTRVWRLVDLPKVEVNMGFDGRRSRTQRARDAALLD